MKKKFLMALFFTGILVWAPAENMVPARADNLVDETVSGDGWVTEGNARYYYTDGKRPPVLRRSPEKLIFLILRPERSRPVLWSMEERNIISAPRQARRCWAGQELMDRSIISDRRAML